MQEYFEKIKERLEEKSLGGMGCPQWIPLESAIEIVNQVEEEYSNSEKSNKLLDSLHEKILKSKFAEEVTEAEIEALVKAKIKPIMMGGWQSQSSTKLQRNVTVNRSTEFEREF